LQSIIISIKLFLSILMSNIYRVKYSSIQSLSFSLSLFFLSFVSFYFIHVCVLLFIMQKCNDLWSQFPIHDIWLIDSSINQTVILRELHASNCHSSWVPRSYWNDKLQWTLLTVLYHTMSAIWGYYCGLHFFSKLRRFVSNDAHFMRPRSSYHRHTLWNLASSRYL